MPDRNTRAASQALISEETETDSLKSFSWSEIEQHTTRESCWFVHNDFVYDVTKYVFYFLFHI